MKKLRPTLPHFNVEKNGAFWFLHRFIIELGGGVVLFLTLFYGDCRFSHLFLQTPQSMIHIKVIITIFVWHSKQKFALQLTSFIGSSL